VITLTVFRVGNTSRYTERSYETNVTAVHDVLRSTSLVRTVGRLVKSYIWYSRAVVHVPLLWRESTVWTLRLFSNTISLSRERVINSNFLSNHRDTIMMLVRDWKKGKRLAPYQPWERSVMSATKDCVSIGQATNLVSDTFTHTFDLAPICKSQPFHCTLFIDLLLIIPLSFSHYSAIIPSLSTKKSKSVVDVPNGCSCST